MVSFWVDLICTICTTKYKCNESFIVRGIIQLLVQRELHVRFSHLGSPWPRPFFSFTHDADEEKRSGKLWGGSGFDWFFVRTMKTLPTGQSVRAKNMNVYSAYGGKLGRKRKSSGIETMTLQNSLQSYRPWANTPPHPPPLKKNECVTRKQECAVVATLLCLISMIVYTSTCTEKQRRKRNLL